MPSKLGKTLGLAAFCLVTFCLAAAQTPQFVSFSSAQPVLEAMRSQLPPELKTSLNATTWDKWVRTEDKEIRSRIEEGEENTLTNLLRMGVTFTTEPAITYEDLDEFGRSKAVDAIADRRANDLDRCAGGTASQRRHAGNASATGEKRLQPENSRRRRRKSKPTCWRTWDAGAMMWPAPGRR